MKSSTRAPLIRGAASSLGEDLSALEAELGEEELEEQRMVELSEQLTQLVAGVSAVSRALADTDYLPDAEGLLMPLLANLHREAAQGEVESALDRIEQGRSREFCVALARWLSHRTTETLLEYGHKLNGDVLNDGAAPELEEITARLWREADDEESNDARSALELMGKLRSSGATIKGERLGKEARSAFESPVADAVGIEHRRATIDLLDVVVAEGLLEDTVAADMLVNAVSRALTESPPPGLEQELAHQLVRMLEWAPEKAHESNLVEAREALTATPWIATQVPMAQTLNLQIEAGLSPAKTTAVPLEIDELAELAENYRDDFIPAAELLLTRFRVGPAAAAKILNPYFRRALPPGLARAVDTYTSRLDGAGRFRFLRGQLQQSYDRTKPRTHLLRQLGIETADPDQVTGAIVERFEKAHRNPEREAVLTIWRAFAPEKFKHRRQLIRRVFVPFCRRNVGGYEACRRNLDLCAPPPRGSKPEILNALAAAPDSDRLDMMRRRMKEVGLRPLPKG
jgi:hypothetical protein